MTGASWLTYGQRESGPAFLAGIIAALLFAVAGYRSMGVVPTIEVYGAGLVAVLAIGYLTWRRMGRR